MNLNHSHLATVLYKVTKSTIYTPTQLSFKYACPKEKQHQLPCNRNTHPCISAKEPVRQRHPQVKIYLLQYLDLHGKQLLPVISIVTDVEEVINIGWCSFLFGEENKASFAVLHSTREINIPTTLQKQKLVNHYTTNLGHYTGTTHIKFTGNEESSGADELKSVPLDDGSRQVKVQNLDTQV